jgi:hypothetical protein
MFKTHKEFWCLINGQRNQMIADARLSFALTNKN